MVEEVDEAEAGVIVVSLFLLRCFLFSEVVLLQWTSLTVADFSSAAIYVCLVSVCVTRF